MVPAYAGHLGKEH